jgi:hypothetical protein
MSILEEDTTSRMHPETHEDKPYVSPKTYRFALQQKMELPKELRIVSHNAQCGERIPLETIEYKDVVHQSVSLINVQALYSKIYVYRIHIFEQEEIEGHLALPCSKEQ